jgi:hypothetical protein
LQRVALVGVAYGLLLNLRYGPQPQGYAIMLLAALFGMSVAGRQVLLHIVPGSGAYGALLLGLHLYTWSFILFALVILGTAVLLVVPRADTGAWTLPAGMKHALAWAIIGLTRSCSHDLPAVRPTEAPTIPCATGARWKE